MDRVRAIDARPSLPRGGVHARAGTLLAVWTDRPGALGATTPSVGAGSAFVYELVQTARAPTRWSGGGRFDAMAHVLFVCLHNAGRSQMSQALFERAAGGRHDAASAGTTPAERVHPEVVQAMRELGVDVGDRVPRLLDRAAAERADVVVTMGCGDECPYIPGKRYLDWDLPDPKGRTVDEVRAIRDTIAERVRGLVRELDGAD
jgi:arsenate reductase